MRIRMAMKQGPSGSAYGQMGDGIALRMKKRPQDALVQQQPGAPVEEQLT